jgi:hypothetical protein
LGLIQRLEAKGFGPFYWESRRRIRLTDYGAAKRTVMALGFRWNVLVAKSRLKNKSCRRHVICYIANSLQYKKCQINRRLRQRIFAATAILSLAVWLFMAAAEVWTPLHAWLHGGSIPDNDDDCAIVALIHGKIETTPCDIPVVIPATWVETTPRIEISVFCPAIENLPLGRAPPALGIAS